MAFAILGAEVWPARLWALLAGALFFVVTFAALHLSVGAYARARGFGDEFWEQYTGELDYLENRLNGFLRTAEEQPRPETIANAPLATSPPVERVSLVLSVVSGFSDSRPLTENAERTNRPLPRWTDMFTSRWGKTRILVFLTYYPLVAGLIIGSATLVLTLDSLAKRIARK